MTEQKTETAIFAGGCFWCTEAVFLEVKGVRAVQSGYIGGHVDAPTYERICDGDTGHAEAVRIEFDPAQVGFDDLLEIFFATHDPCTLNRQGNDVGTQYRSAIFYHSEEQKKTAEASIRSLAESAVHHEPIVTQVVPATTFYPAHDDHQDYYNRNSKLPYCRFVIQPKLEKIGLEQ